MASATSGGGRSAEEEAAPRLARSLPVFSAVGSGLVVGALLVVMASSYAALVFSGAIGVHLQKGIGLNLFGAAVALTVVGLMSTIPVAIAGPQDVTAAILGLSAASIATQIAPDDSATFLTVVLVVGLTSALTGAFFLVLGTFGLGDLIRYVPYPVVGGFLAGTGWLLVKGGIGVTTGTPLSWSTLSDHAHRPVVTKSVLVLGIAAVLVWTVRRYRHPLVVPAILGAVVAAFYLVVLVSGSSLREAELGGWLLGPFPSGDMWRPWAVEAVGSADWGVLGSQVPTVVSAVLVGVLGLLLNSSGIEMATNRDLDFNRELRAAGTANLLVGAAGGMPAYQKLSATVLAHVLGATTRLVALVAAGVCGVTLTFGASVLSLFPRLALGGLLTFLGLSLLVEWVYDASYRLRRVEYVLVLAILVVVAAFGFLAGVAFGLAVAVVLFVVDISRSDVVHAEFGGATLPSNIDRAPGELAVLQARADSIHVVRLQGFLFFGTANGLLLRIRERAEKADDVPLAFLVLDFKRVTGIDSSAVVSFLKVSRLGRSMNFSIVMTGMGPAMERQLARGGLVSDDNLLILPDLDRALQACEDRIVQEADVGASSAVPALLHLDLTGTSRDPAALSSYLEELHLPEGHVLIREGDCADDLFVLESGRLTSFLEQPDGRTVRLRTMGPGTIVGEVGLYGGGRRTAFVVTDAPSTVHRLSRHALEAMEREDPRAAAELHKAIAGLLAERLTRTLRSQSVLTD